ncbi:hypothetical protein AVDCRST_MAG84-5501, partial [uncultured Microcoleus sp.]
MSEFAAIFFSPPTAGRNRANKAGGILRPVHSDATNDADF